MPQTNSERISHDLAQKQNTYRTSNGEQILNDIAEELDGIGFSQAVYRSPPQQVFIDKIIVWENASMLKKRAEVVFNYGTSFPFIEQITKTIFKEDGSASDSTVLAVFVYNANKTIQSVTVSSARV